MNSAFHTSRRVEFRDTDAAGLMHFSSFFVMMEEAEHELLRSLGTSVVLHDDEGVMSWPRVAASCDYHGAVRFEDVLEIDVRLIRLGTKSVTYGFHFTCDGRDVAEGRVTVVCCRITPGEPPRSIPIPPSLAEKFSTLSGR